MSSDVDVTLCHDHWLRFGYFPNGIPPCFTTKPIADSAFDLKRAWDSVDWKRAKRPYSSPALLSVAKRGHLRRQTHLTNPIHQMMLVAELCNNWQTIRKHVEQSPLSLSLPILDENRDRHIRTSKNHRQVEREHINLSGKYRYLLKVDLQEFYASIYTHSIEWALAGKEHVKARRAFSLDVQKEIERKLGEKLDTLIRNTKDQETKGIPVGPDTSLVMAEIIGAELDTIFCERIEEENFSWDGYRHVDDMAFFIRSQNDAQKILEVLRGILSDYHLQVNEIKTKIVTLPEPFKATWTSELAQTKFSSKHRYDELRHFFTKAFFLQKEYPTDSILKYALQMVRPFANKKSNQQAILGTAVEEEWELLRVVLAQALYNRPDTIIVVHDILAWYDREQLDTTYFRDVINHFLADIPSQCDHEIVWALWIAQTLRIFVCDEAVKNLSRSQNPLVGLMILMLAEKGLIKSLPVQRWKSAFSYKSAEKADDWVRRLLYGNQWIFAYEAAKHEWLGLDENLLKDDPFFCKLHESDIYFLDFERDITDAEIDSGFSHIGVGGMMGGGATSGT